MDRTKIALVFSLLMLILAFRFIFFYQNQPQYVDGQRVAFTTILFSEPQIVGSQQRLSANLGNRKVFIRAPLHPQFHYGNRVSISGPIRLLPRTREEPAYGTSSEKPRVKTKEKLVMVMYFPKIEKLRTFLAIASFVRQKTTSLLKLALPPTYSSLLLGIVFGIKEEMPENLLENLRISGVMHVIAASGMNVIMAGGFLSSLFGFFLRRQIALVASIIGVLFYAVLAGLEPSIVRASIMGILVFVAQIMGRQSLALYGFSIAFFAMLFVSPQTLFDIGFQLSFLATLGLLYIKPLFEKDKKIKKFVKRSILGEGITTTLSAQAATLPILLGNFGSYSLWSVLVNGLVLWTIPVLMALGGLAAIVGFTFGFLGQLILYFSLPLLFYFEKIVNIFANLEGVLNLPTLPWQIAVGYYSLLLALVILLKKK